MLVHVFRGRKSFAWFTLGTGFKLTQDVFGMVQIVLPIKMELVSMCA